MHRGIGVGDGVAHRDGDVARQFSATSIASPENADGVREDFAKILTRSNFSSTWASAASKRGRSPDPSPFGAGSFSDAVYAAPWADRASSTASTSRPRYLAISLGRGARQ